MSEKTYDQTALREVLARKERGRRQRAALRFGETLDILDRLRENELTFGAELRAAMARTIEEEKRNALDP